MIRIQVVLSNQDSSVMIFGEASAEQTKLLNDKKQGLAKLKSKIKETDDDEIVVEIDEYVGEILGLSFEGDGASDKILYAKASKIKMFFKYFGIETEIKKGISLEERLDNLKNIPEENLKTIENLGV